jgi:hypothetical protein
MAFASTKLAEKATKNPAIVLEIFKYTKANADASGTITCSRCRRIRQVVAKTDTGATATINSSNRKQLNLTTLDTTVGDGNDLVGAVVIEVERI